MAVLMRYIHSFTYMYMYMYLCVNGVSRPQGTRSPSGWLAPFSC